MNDNGDANPNTLTSYPYDKDTIDWSYVVNGGICLLMVWYMFQLVMVSMSVDRLSSFLVKTTFKKVVFVTTWTVIVTIFVVSIVRVLFFYWAAPAFNMTNNWVFDGISKRLKPLKGGQCTNFFYN